MRCDILRADDHEREYFEEARIEPALCLDYDTPRVIDLSVIKPSDYDDEESGGDVETIACITIAEARQLIVGMERAIAQAEREQAAKKPKRSPAKRKHA